MVTEPIEEVEEGERVPELPVEGPPPVFGEGLWEEEVHCDEVEEGAEEALDAA